MPRNSQGVYVETSSNPVTTGTPIEADWANETIADIAQALTDSLDRQGRGGMIAPFKLVDGTVGAPGFSFSAEPSTGLYRAGANDLGITVGGVRRIRIQPGAVTMIAPLILARDPVNPLEAATQQYVDTNLVSSLAAYARLDGAAFTGSISTSGNFTAGGGVGAAFGSFSGTVGAAVFAAGNGTAAAPGISFAADPAAGLFRAGTNDIGIAVGGAIRMRFQPGAVSMLAPLLLSRDPLVAAEAATMNYVEARLGQLLPQYARLDGAAFTASISTSGNLTATGGVGAAFFSTAGAVLASGYTARAAGAASYLLQDTSAGTDLKFWDVYAGSGGLAIRALNDAQSAATAGISFSRLGAVINSVALGASTSIAGILTVTNTGVAGYGGQMRLVNGNTGAGPYFRVNSDNDLEILNAGATFVSARFADATGNLTTQGAIQAGSDRRLKTDFDEISAEDGYRLLHAVSPMRYTRRLDGSREAGYVTQQVELVAPELVGKAALKVGDEAFDSLNYSGVTSYLHAALRDMALRLSAAGL